MIKKSILGMLLLATPFLASAQFDGAVGTEGCKAISNSDNRILSWAVGCQVNRGWQDIATKEAKASFGTIEYAIGEATTSTTTEAISLGDGGTALLTFDRPIVNGAGPDFAVFENSFNDSFLELAFVEVSSDGIHFVRFPAISNTSADEQVDGFGSLDPTKLYNLAGKYRIGWGTPFDLEELKDSANLDVNNVRFVRLVDVIGIVDNPELASFDSNNNPVNDPYPTDFASSGFDLTGVAVLNGGRPYDMSDFAAFNFTTADTAVVPVPGEEDEPDDYDIYWFVHENGKFFFDVAYDGYYKIFSDGFVPTNRTNDTVQAYDYAAITAGGLNGRGTNYMTAYVSAWVMDNHTNIYFTDGEAHQFNGAYITNSTCAYVSMTNGDGMAKKFEQGDWFKLIATGLDENSEEHVAEFYLADFRSENPEEHYIVKDWRFFDLSVLGPIVHLSFAMESSDASIYGMNTPAYFCMDALSLINENTEKVNVGVVSANEEMGTATGTGMYAYGSQVVAKAIANEGYKFVKWSNENTDTVYVFNALENVSLTATFRALESYTVTLDVNDNTMGTVEGAGEYAEDAQATISATANQGFHFVKWSDENTDAERTLTITEDVELTAIFEADENPDAIAENEFSNAQILSGEKRIVITNAANATVAVFDAAGRNVVKEQRITSNRETIALPQSGIYIVRMNNNTTAKLFVR